MMKRYEFIVSIVIETEWDRTSRVLGHFFSFASSQRKAISNIRFKNGFRDYDTLTEEVSFHFVLVEDFYSVEDEDRLPLYRTMNGEDYILTDGGTYEFICD